MARYIDAEPLPNGQFWDNCTDTEKAKILKEICLGRIKYIGKDKK